MEKFFYSNAVEVTTKLYDVQIKFGLTDAKNETIDYSVIAMSPQHTKILAMVLGQAIEAYEKQFGIINIADAKVDTKKQDEK